MIDCNKMNIKKGSKGSNVTTLQQYLWYFGYYDGGIDGDCGTYTVEAIKKYQKDKGLVVDGVFGPVSCKASSINGEDISKGDKQITLSVFKDMVKRHDQFMRDNGREPTIIYLSIIFPFQYVSLSKYNDLLGRYNKFIKDNNREPNYLNMQTPTSNNNNANATNNTKTTQTTTNNNGIYTSSPHYETKGCNKEGQCTSYFCACVSLSQILRKWGITKYTQQTIASYMGTTSKGTGHNGIETAIAVIAKQEKLTLKVEWKNFSDLGSTREERFETLGKIFSQPNKGVIIHDYYRNQYGHYETLKNINTKNKTIIVLNSLGSKCNSPAYCGYNETRSYKDMASYIAGISQKSICIITKE